MSVPDGLQCGKISLPFMKTAAAGPDSRRLLRWAYRHPGLTAVLLGFLTCICFSCTPFLILDRPSTVWNDYLLKNADPFLDGSRVFPAHSHGEKLTFRLTVPLLCHALGLGRDGMLVAMAAATAALFWGAFHIALENGRSVGLAWGSVALLAGLRAACLGLYPTAGYYDIFALALLALACLPRLASAVGILVFLACWTDERGFLASSFVWLYHLLPRPSGASGRPPLSLGQVVRGNPRTWAIVGAWMAYAAIRAFVTWAFHIELPSDDPALHIRLNAEVMPWVIWGAFETGWFVAGAAVAAACRRRELWGAWHLVLGLAGMFLAAAAVADVTRSAAFALPGYFVALRLLGRSIRLQPLGSLALGALLIQNYELIWAANRLLEWTFPLPAAVLYGLWHWWNS